jgi:hypothetical protein
MGPAQLPLQQGASAASADLGLVAIMRSLCAVRTEESMREGHLGGIWATTAGRALSVVQ